MRPLLSVAVAAGLALCGCGEAPPSKVSAPKNELFGNLAASTSGPCEGGGIATGDEVAVTKDVGLRSGPSLKSDRVINEKATSVLGYTEYQAVDNTERLKELCRQKAWSKVQVVEPSWLANVVGWVPVSALRSIERDSSGRRTYVEADFPWDRDTSRYKPQLVAAVNRIVRENERCPTIDPGTLMRSPNRGTDAKPVFFVTCAHPTMPFNVWFEPSDASGARRFAAVANIDQGSAILACERAAKLAATNPQTVNFSTFMDVAFVPYPNGNSRLLSSFTAQNSFGVKGKFRIECFFEGLTLAEQRMSETID